MHVAILCDFATADGGAPMVAIRSARALAEAGVRVSFIHAVGGDGDPRLIHPLITRIDLGGRSVWAQNPLMGAARGVWNAALRRRLEAILSGLPAGALVHAHQWTKAFSPSAFAAIRRSRRPLVVTLHDYFLTCPIGLHYRFDTHAPCTLRPLSARCLVASCDPASRWHKGVRVARSLATQGALWGHAYDLIHISDRSFAQAAALLPDHVRHHRIDNPIDIAPCAPRDSPKDGKFAFLGRLTEEKGVEMLVHAARRVGLPPLLIGDGPLRGRLQALDPSLDMRGWLAPDAVIETLRREAIALVAPSLWPETGPMSVPEAMANGIPVIVSARAGAAELVIHGENGIVAAPEETALAEALSELSDPSRAAAMGRCAHARYWADAPTPARHAQALIALYERILRSSAALRQAV